MRASRGLAVACWVGVGLLSASPAIGESNAASTFHGGAWALQFRVSDDFTLSSFKGSVLSVKRHHSDAAALRLGVSTTLSSGDQERRYGSPGEVEELSGDVSQYAISTDLQYLRYAGAEHWAHLFAGAGPTFGYRRQESTERNSSMGRSDVSRMWTAGLAGTLGVELFPLRGIGLHAEYGVTAGFISEEREAEEFESGRISNSRVDSWELEGQGALLGVSVYF